jgi:hypothetical protein
MPAALPTWLKLLDDWRVLVCMPNRRGVAPSQVNTHLSECQGKLGHSLRKEIVELVKRLQLPEPADVGKPPDGGQALPELELHHGFHCKWPGYSQQYYICTNHAMQVTHQRQHHAG